jgi:hypothetical protein
VRISEQTRGSVSKPSDKNLQRRRAAASEYKPDEIDLLLVAEAPPSSPDRYFHFTDVREHDSLFRYVSRVLVGGEVSREGKQELLKVPRCHIQHLERGQAGTRASIRGHLPNEMGVQVAIHLSDA